MKKAMKTLPLAIAFALLAAFIPLLSGGGMTARADGDFTIENGVLKKYNGSGGYVVVPDGVKTIDERAFYNNLTITGVRLPDSVMQIKSFAFYACANLKEATLPSDLRTIGTSAFYECNLQSLTLSVKATGSGLKYQWYFKKTSQSAFSVWNGHTHATETCTPNDTWNGIRLYCRVTDGGGNKINSDEATVTLASALAITTQPTSKTVTLGESVTLSLKATGEGLTYQWYYKKKGASSFTLWSSRTHASETVTPNATWDGIQLYCIVKDGSGNTKQSNTITVTVKTVPPWRFSDAVPESDRRRTHLSVVFQEEGAKRFQRVERAHESHGNLHAQRDVGRHSALLCCQEFGRQHDKVQHHHRHG